MFRFSSQMCKILRAIDADFIIKTKIVGVPLRLCTVEQQNTFGTSFPRIKRYIAMSSNFGSTSDERKLRQCLSPLQFHVTQEKGTELPYTGKFTNFSEPGTYTCIVCKSKIFSSKAKYDSGCGWPAFSDVIDPKSVKLTTDLSHGMLRTEVTCSNCEAHLGHVFDDGPKPTGLRYCINSSSLDFSSEKDEN